MPEITPKLLTLIETLRTAQEETAKIQNSNQNFLDKKRRPDPGYQSGDKVWIQTHPQSNKKRKYTAKFAPKREGPYIILQKQGPASYEVGDINGAIIGKYHTSSIVKCNDADNIETMEKRKGGRSRKPVQADNIETMVTRKRGRPRKQVQALQSL